MQLLLEQKSPAGYSLNTERQPVTVVSGETVEITVSNTLLPPDTGTLKIIKKDGDGKLLEGALFYVYSADTDKKVGEMTTGKDGVATLELPGGGAFFLREQKAPSSYRLSDENIRFGKRSCGAERPDHPVLETAAGHAGIEPQPQAVRWPCG